MASVEELLMDSLNELEEAELKKFQWYLKNEDRISKSEIAKADIFKTVDMIVACFKQKGAVKITVDTLRKINQNDLAEKLENNYKQFLAKDNKKTSALAETYSSLGSVTQFQPLTQTTQVNTSRTARGLQAFMKGKPKALGIVQIITGLLSILFGIMAGITFPSFSFIIGFPFWGSAIYITAGSLSVAAKNKLASSSSLCLVKGSLGMNIVAIFTAGLSIVAFLVELSSCSVYCGRVGFEDNYREHFLAVHGILLIFTVLEFVISIHLSGFACKATCCTSSGAQPV
ncbi:membrane-spanning 4-domains subfamily A member 4A-like [Ctenopharyngodon idella]|uniref:membrane-spanning 4-domains subfamily A member 4A-like n=1 Tax=Ctenopharyngodon idella TaxID=7959 RepID=UPI0022310D5B|nr:membrane-spanning 4-domains subfamily A member 4A-like [Ctenopharyngodon idella]XP_051746594.1 membrane-spanning 4-domains subfamily A member 4A-like [Ctenopharyngodon idella]